MRPIVIVGTGLGGYTAATDLGGCSRMPSRRENPAAALITSNAAQMASPLRAQILTHTQITAIELGEKRAYFSGGERGYEKLALVLGTDPIRLPLQGFALAGAACAEKQAPRKQLPLVLA